MSNSENGTSGTPTEDVDETVPEGRLESLEQENEQLREQVESLESTVSELVDLNETDSQLSENGSGGDEQPVEPKSAEEAGITPAISRRGALAGLATVGLLGAGAVGSASAASKGDTLTFGNGFSGNPSTNTGLTLVNTGSSGFKTGLTAEAQSPSGIGLRGEASAGSGTNAGVQGVSESPKGKALQGTNLSTTGPAVGLEGQTKAADGVGLRGLATETGTGESSGVVGITGSSGSNSAGSTPAGVNGVASADQNSSTPAESTYGVWGRTFSSDENAAGVFGEAPNGNAPGIATPDNLEVGGDLIVSGTKNFVQTVDTSAGQRDVFYTAVEAGTPRTECSGVERLEDGRATIEMPEHFSLVTSDSEDLVVALTPYEDEGDLTVVERSTERIVVEAHSDAPADLQFSYIVKGTRSGFEDREVVRESEGTLSPDEPSMPSYDEK